MPIAKAYHPNSGRLLVGDPVKVLGSNYRGIIERFRDMGKGRILATIWCTDNRRRIKPLRILRCIRSTITKTQPEAGGNAAGVTEADST